MSQPYDSAMSQALALINSQTDAVNGYFQQANQAFGQQYNNYYAQTMQDAVNSLAGSGVYGSPVSENMLGRTRTNLAQTYATGISTLAGQKVTAEGGIAQQKVGYYQTLGGLAAAAAEAKEQRKSQMWSTIAGLGSSLI